MPVSAKQYCGPYMHANAAGFYIYSPLDIDIALDPSKAQPWYWQIHGKEFSDDEVEVLRSMPLRHPNVSREMIRPRTKLFFSGPSNEPVNTAQIWTGCIFQTPPGWALWLRNPINRGYDCPFRIDEAIIETDWLQNDIWINLRFYRFGEVANIRRDGTPLAHIVPIPREAYESWEFQERMLDPADADAQDVFDRWVEYNWEKFYRHGPSGRDSTVYHRQRKKHREDQSNS